MKFFRTLPLLALASAAGIALSCNTSVRDTDRQDRPDSGVSTLSVTLQGGDPGTPSMPQPYSANGVHYDVHIEALGGDGTRVAGLDSWVVMRVNPGTMTSIDGLNGAEVQGRNVHLIDGQADVRVNFLRAYGETRIWAEEDGYVPADVSRDPPPSCADGIDNDGDGQVDYPADYGCAAANDDTEEGGSYAAAASEPIYFASPTLYDVQGASSMSPLVNERITVTAGNLIVTRISIQGFWVTDTAETHTCPDPVDTTLQRPCYNSIFAFNFRLPDGLRPCDHITMVQGTVQEFASTTQFNQPAWTPDPDGLYFDIPDAGPHCPIPDAIEIGPSSLMNSSTVLEPYESSLVIARNATLPVNVGPDHPTCDATANRCDFAPGRSNCDYTGDSKIDFTNPDEALCSNLCQTTQGCSEWTNWLRFGQVSVDLPGQAAGVQRLVIAPKGAVPDFDPQFPADAEGQHFPTGTTNRTVTATGTLKQVGPNWIIEPRCTEDLVFPWQTVLPANASCLIPRPPPEE